MRPTDFGETRMLIGKFTGKTLEEIEVDMVDNLFNLIRDYILSPDYQPYIEILDLFAAGAVILMGIIVVAVMGVICYAWWPGKE